MADFRFGNYDFSGPPHIPVYVMLPLETISETNEVTDPQGLRTQLQALKGAGVEGVMVDCWWGRVQGKDFNLYNWNGYKDLFSIVKGEGLKIKAVMSFHKCGGNVGDNVTIPLPKWVTLIGDQNSDIYYKDRSGPNDEYLTLGIDNETVLNGHTALQVYESYMRSFKSNMDEEYLKPGIISGIEVGLGPSGELRYPSYPQFKGWQYPNIGEFQCEDKYMKKSLATMGQAQGWGAAPQDAGNYNSKPQDTLFFKDGGGYSTPYGKFFLSWYSGKLIEHGGNVMQRAKGVFNDVEISAKVPGIYWWYDTKSHAAEATAGLFTGDGNSVYRSIARMLANNNALFNFTCAEMRNVDKIVDNAQCNPEGLFTEVLNAAYNCPVPTACENALPPKDLDVAYSQILKNTKLMLGATGQHVRFFTYLRLGADLMGKLGDFTRFVRCMRGRL
ncbi:unnamed protein product [Sphagnum compactum]